jgi:hypothetical protein
VKLPAQNKSMEQTITLYRPVGPVEMALIRESGCRAFPPRLPGQPIFYPVLTEEYAVQIARDWNATDAKQKAGFVTKFQVQSSYLSEFEVHTVGGSIHKEYWIPAEELANFNAANIGVIEVIAEFHLK